MLLTSENNLKIMASLVNILTNNIIILNTYHQFGRALPNHTPIMANDVSRNHAVIYWEESVWKISDHSKNGTIIDNRVICHKSKKLQNGSKIQFGSSESTIWRVLDTNPPCSYLKSNSRENTYFELSSPFLWPNDICPEVSFYKTADNVWKADLGSEIVRLENRQILHLGLEEWEYTENEIISATIDLNDISKQACFIFNVSADEEVVGVKIVISDLQLDLGERIYNHVLLRLVMQKQLDLQRKYDKEKQGWVTMEEMTNYLCKELMTDVDEYYVNVQIHRLRKRLFDLSPYGYIFSNIIERKNGELRFSHPHFDIIKKENTGIVTKNVQTESFFLS
jgi:hypothetical protein